MKIILRFIKKLVLSFLLLFCYNLFLNSFNLNIPINLVTLSVIFLLDIPGIIALFIFQLLAL